MPCKIVIPSYKRHDTVLTTKLVNDAIICVSESEKDLYKDYNPDNEIVTHPDSIKGLVPKRNWMADHFKELFMLDDDLTLFRRMWITYGENPVIRDKSYITMEIYKLHEMATLLGINVFGFSNINHPVGFDDFEPYTLRRSITGCAYGVIKKEHIRWDEDFQLKEDFYISCIAKYYDRKILVSNLYNFTQKKTFKSAGGLSEIRNHATEMKNMLMLKKYFGDAINVKSGTLTNPLAKKHNITTSFKF